MPECAGWFGKILGHDFKEFILKKRIVSPGYSSQTAEISGSESIKAFMDSQRDTLEIRCKRCGRKENE